MKMSFEQPKNELAPDLQWMLASRQVSGSLLLETLIHEYYAPVFRLVLTFLDDPQASQLSVRDIFSVVLLNVHRYRATQDVEEWFYKIAWKVCMRSYRREVRWKRLEKLLALHGELTVSNHPTPADDVEAELWQAIDELDDRSRFIFILNQSQGWSPEKISTIIGVSQIQVETGLENATHHLADKLGNKGISFEKLRDQIVPSLEQRWPVPDIDDAHLDQLVSQIEHQAHRGKLLRGPYATLSELAVLIAVLIMVLGLAWFGNRLITGDVSPKQALTTAVPTWVMQSPIINGDGSLLMPPRYAGSSSAMNSSSTTETPEGIFYIGPPGNSLEEVANRLAVTIQDLRRFNRIPDDELVYQGQWIWVPNGPILDDTWKIATPVAPVTYTLPLKVPKIAKDLNQLLYPDRLMYHTVWVDGLVTVHQKSDPGSPPKTYRIQLWLSENEGLLVGGPSDQAPAEVFLWLGGRSYVAKPDQASPWFQKTGVRLDDSPMSVPLLYGTIMLLKQTQIWESPNLFYIEPGSFAGRETWIVEAGDSQNQPVALIHLDRKTGFVLHYLQLKDNPESSSPGQDLPDEVRVRKINFDVNFPQELFNPSIPWRGGYALDYSGIPSPNNSSP